MLQVLTLLGLDVGIVLTITFSALSLLVGIRKVVSSVNSTTSVVSQNFFQIFESISQHRSSLKMAIETATSIDRHTTLYFSVQDPCGCGELCGILHLLQLS